MNLLNFRNTRCLLALAGLFAVVWIQLFPFMSYAQNSGNSQQRARLSRVKLRPSRKGHFSTL
jgi:hypothetical protein